MWFQRVILNDNKLTLTAVRLAGLVLGSYEIGVGNPVKLPLRRTAEQLGVKKDTLIHARDLLVERGWLVRVNSGSSRTGAYDLGPGPRVRSAGPSRVRSAGPHYNKSSTRLSDSELAQTQSLPKIESRRSLKLPLMAVVPGGRA